MIYEPAEDSFLLLKHIKDFASGKVLDMGSGSGVLAEEALKYTDDVLAVDKNPEAVALLKEKGLNVRESDLFSNVEGRFDLIIFNPPYLPREESEDEGTALITSGEEGPVKLLDRFFSEAYKHLEKEGKILIVFSSLTGDVDSILRKYNYKWKLLDSEKLFFEELFVYLVFR